MPQERELRERDILVASNEYAYVQDLTKGDIVLYVGPTKISLSNTERLVEFRNGRFVPVRGEEGGLGVNPFVVASSAQYIILENPPKDPNVRTVKGNNSAIELLIGKKFVVSGPATFPLWPGQKAQVIDGHELREDQYLVIRVYDRVEGENDPIGTQRIVKGSEVSFYIPKTGLEVVPDEKGYVRSAVTLLEGEYCILLAPNGQTRFVRGPAVVFPGPMEEFVRKGGTKIFKAVPQRKNMGLRVRVLKDFTAADSQQVPAGKYTAGQEIFLKDREGFFFPSESLEVTAEVQAIPIAEKEGIYVRNLETGKVATEIGPKNTLADPTKTEIVSRALDPEIEKLYGVTGRDKGKAVSIYIPPSYAVMVTGKNKREVVIGPATRILDFDEDLEILKLSTGKPKTDETLLSTCFLQITGNKVSDIVRVKTADHVELEVTASYRVTFVAQDAREREKWFNVKNYVGLLCDHLGSIVRAAVQATPIESFHTRSAEVVRAAILGEKKGEEKRVGRHFAENAMSVYDVEVLDVKILDQDVKKLLSDAQRSAIVSEVQKKQENLRLSNESVKQEVDRRIYEAQMTTIAKAIDLEGVKRNLSEARVREAVELDKLEKVGKAQNQAQALDVSSTAAAAAAEREAQVEIKSLSAKVGAFKEQMSALQPELVTTLKVLGDQEMSKELTRNLSPLAILGGQSVAEVAERLLKALPVGIVLKNGAAEPVTKARKKTAE
ncbi:MAG: hypothetical protein HYY17_00815 [Planctomycetes bacterium]|nr:hypothetical protein [Planctomycetota bacterium]